MRLVKVFRALEKKKNSKYITRFVKQILQNWIFYFNFSTCLQCEAVLLLFYFYFLVHTYKLFYFLICNKNGLKIILQEMIIYVHNEYFFKCTYHCATNSKYIVRFKKASLFDVCLEFSVFGSSSTFDHLI